MSHLANRETPIIRNAGDVMAFTDEADRTLRSHIIAGQSVLKLSLSEAQADQRHTPWAGSPGR